MLEHCVPVKGAPMLGFAFKASCTELLNIREVDVVVKLVR